jgi:alkylation response protein AidB-like acyl-CoA dehydrogenase
MNFGLTDDQSSVAGELSRLVASLHLAAPTAPVRAPYSDPLDRAISDAGFLDIARESGFGPLDGALVAEAIARLPHIIEAASSALVAPALGIPAGQRPVALVANDATRPARFLPQARVLLVDLGDRALQIEIDPSKVLAVDSLFAYPFGRLVRLDDHAVKELRDVATLRRRWRISIAVEAAGCMAGALALVVEHVKARHAFGRPLGAFQGIQHRLAMAAETVESCRWLAFRAAWSDSDADAAIAAGFAQARIAPFTYDLQQFTGAMGLTLEYPLHLWTYRLRALAGELGGASVQERQVAAATWPDHAA